MTVSGLDMNNAATAATPARTAPTAATAFQEKPDSRSAIRSTQATCHKQTLTQVSSQAQTVFARYERTPGLAAMLSDAPSFIAFWIASVFS